MSSYARPRPVYRRAIDGTGQFERCTDGLPEWFDDNVDTFCLAASGGSAANDDDRTVTLRGQSPDSDRIWCFRCGHVDRRRR